MTRVSVACAALVALAAFASEAFAHGGEVSPPPPDPVPGVPPRSSNPSGPQVPPGTADPPAPITRWETWWAANKEFYLQLNVKMRELDGPESRGLNGEAPKSAKPTEAERAARAAAVREALVPVFVEALCDPDFEVRTAAAVALGKSGGEAGGAPLRKAAEGDAHKDVRDSAVLGLGLLGRPGNIPWLDSVLCDARQNTRHRSFAAFALGLIGGEDAAAALLGFADGKPGKPGTFLRESPELIASSFVAMGMTGDARVLPVLRSALTDGQFDDNVRAFVVLSLGRMRDRVFLPEVGKLLVSERDVGVRRSAAVALGRIATAGDVGATEALLTAVNDDSDEMVRHFSAISLGGFKDAAVSKRLEKMFAEARTNARPFLALALAIAGDKDASPALRSAFAKEGNESVKSSYCVALGIMGDVEAAPLLEKALADRGLIWLQGYAAIALGILHHYDSAPALNARLAGENDPRLRANLAVGLGLLHDPGAKAYLVKTLRSGDGSVYERGGAAMAMGVLRMSDAVTDLIDVYHDKKEQDLVRAFAVVALGLIADPAPFPKLARFAIDNNYTLRTDPLNEVLSIF